MYIDIFLLRSSMSCIPTIYFESSILCPIGVSKAKKTVKVSQFKNCMMFGPHLKLWEQPKLCLTNRSDIISLKVKKLNIRVFFQILCVTMKNILQFINRDTFTVK